MKKANTGYGFCLMITFFTGLTNASAQSTLEEAGNEMMANLAVIAFGTELGAAQGCNFPKTGEYSQRVKTGLYAMNLPQATKTGLWNLFEQFRKDSKQSVDIVEMENRKSVCDDVKQGYLDSPVWDKDWKMGMEQKEM